MPVVRSSKRSSIRIVLVALWMGLTAAPGAHATPVVPPAPASPITLTAPGVTSFSSPEPELAVNASGASVAAWTVSQQRATKFVAGPSRVEVSFRAPGSTWTAPITISAADRIAGSPHVGIDAQGVSTIAWQEFANDQSVTPRVRVATAIGAVVGPVQDFVSESGQLTELSLAVAPTGSAVLAYTQWHKGADAALETNVLVARRAASVAPFGAPAGVLPPGAVGRAWHPTVQASASGHVAVAWVEQPAGADVDTARVKLERAGPGADFGSARDVSGPREVELVDPVLALDPAGATTVAWMERRSIASPQEPAGWAIVSTRMEGDEAVGPRQVIAAQTGASLVALASQLQLASDASGQVTAAWASVAGGEFSGKERVQVATAPAGGSFRAPVTLTDYAQSPDLDLAVEASGATAVAYGGAGQVLAVHWRAAGSAAFIGLGKVSDRWAQPVSIAFGGGPDDLTLLFGTDYAPVFFVQTTTTTSASPTPTAPPSVTPTPVVVVKDRRAPVVTVGAVKRVPVLKPGKRGHTRQTELTVVVSASEPATISASLSTRRPGVRQRGRCVATAVASGPRKDRKACVRTVALGKPVVSNVGAVPSTLDLGPAPAAGSYTVTVTATDAAGNVAAPVTRRFRLNAGTGGVRSGLSPAASSDGAGSR